VGASTAIRITISRSFNGGGGGLSGKGKYSSIGGDCDGAGARHLPYRYGVRFYQLYSLNQPIRIFYPRDGKSLLARLLLVL